MDDKDKQHTHGGKALYHWLQAQRLSATAFALAYAIPAGAIGDYLHGRSRPHAERRRKLHDICGIDPAHWDLRLDGKPYVGRKHPLACASVYGEPSLTHATPAATKNGVVTLLPVPRKKPKLDNDQLRRIAEIVVAISAEARAMKGGETVD